MECTFAIFLVTLLCHSLCFAQQTIFYVTAYERGHDCPQNSECSTLQNYTSRSQFTSNRIFIFLKGRHEFEAALSSKNVANLTLRGENFGVIVFCVSTGAKIEIGDFSQLIIDNLEISGVCSSPVIALNGGTNAQLGHLKVSPSSGTSTILNAVNVEGSFSVSDSNFFIASDYFDAIPVLITYTDCGEENNFVYDNNTVFVDSSSIVYELFELQLRCNVDVKITNSNFGKSNTHLSVNVCGWSSTLLISKSIFTKSHLDFTFCPEATITCIQDCFTFEDLQMISSQLTYAVNAFSSTSIGILNSIFSEFSNASEAVISISGPELSSTKVYLTDVTFSHNGALSQNYLNNVDVSYTNCTFNYNSGTAIQAMNSNVSIDNNCIVENNIGTAIEAQNSEIIFQGESTFRNNRDTIGGAIQLLSLSYMFLQEDASILFVDNHADYLGGAIYIDHEEKDGCFFDSESFSPSTSQVIFVNNTANYSGFAMYGNGISLCCGPEDPSCSSFLRRFDFSGNPSAIGSDPSNVCFCDEINEPDCTRKTHSIEVFPGQDFFIHLAVVGTVLESAVPGSVRVYNYDKSVLQNSQTLQKSDDPECVKMPYAVNSTEASEKFNLTIEQSLIAAFTDVNPLLSLEVIVHLKDCPRGFVLSNMSRGCECHPNIEKYSVQCNINDQTFLLPPNSWIDYNVSCDGDNCVAFSSNCPVGYCSSKPAFSSSLKPYMPCFPNRTGALCSKCKDGYSLALGNQACIECSHYWLFLIIPMALAGLFLVFILFFLNLTVTEGTINGLLFYANIIAVYHRTLLVLAASAIESDENEDMQFEVENSYLYVVLAWINLDFGIDNTCFYHGMNHYHEAWLQFVFPVYLWTIILVIILLHKKFPRLAAKCGGENTVSVLATLLLMSFTKLIRTIATILSSTPLGSQEVWRYDASHEFFKGAHIYLGIAGLFVAVFLIIPYVICMTFFQQFQAFSGHKPFKWVNKLMPVYDAYASPYKDQYRFWTGLLLLVRMGLVILYNCVQSLSVNLLITVVISFALAVVNSNGIYKKWPCNFLESFFFCQLGVFSAVVAYFQNHQMAITVFSNISFGLSIIVFLGIVGYHGYVRFKKCCRRKGYEKIDEGNKDAIVSTRPTPTPTPPRSPSPTPCPSPDTY